MGLFKRGEIWWYIKQYKQERYTDTLGTSNKKVAEEVYYKDILPTIINGTYWEKRRQQEQNNDVTFGELWERYKEKYAKERDPYTIKYLLPVFGNKVAKDIDIEDVEDYIDTRLAEDAAYSTVYKEFALARVIFNTARKKWKDDYGVLLNPFSDAGFPTFENQRDRWLTLEEEDKLVKAASPEWVKDVITFAIHTGCRRGEILDIHTKKGIDMGRRTVTVQASKHGNKKVIPMSNKLHTMLKKRLKVTNISGRLFDVTVAAVKDAFDRAVKNAELEDLHFHDLRHTFATRLVQLGEDLYKVQRLMGHKSIKMTERYAHHNPESLKSAATAMDNYYNTTTVEKEAVAAGC